MPDTPPSAPEASSSPYSTPPSLPAGPNISFPLPALAPPFCAVAPPSAAPSTTTFTPPAPTTTPPFPPLQLQVHASSTTGVLVTSTPSHSPPPSCAMDVDEGEAAQEEGEEEDDPIMVDGMLLSAPVVPIPSNLPSIAIFNAPTTISPPTYAFPRQAPSTTSPSIIKSSSTIKTYGSKKFREIRPTKMNPSGARRKREKTIRQPFLLREMAKKKKDEKRNVAVLRANSSPPITSSHIALQSLPPSITNLHQSPEIPHANPHNQVLERSQQQHPVIEGIDCMDEEPGKFAKKDKHEIEEGDANNNLLQRPHANSAVLKQAAIASAVQESVASTSPSPEPPSISVTPKSPAISPPELPSKPAPSRDTKRSNKASGDDRQKVNYQKKAELRRPLPENEIAPSSPSRQAGNAVNRTGIERRIASPKAKPTKPREAEAFKTLGRSSPRGSLFQPSSRISLPAFPKRLSAPCTTIPATSYLPSSTITILPPWSPLRTITNPPRLAAAAAVPQLPHHHIALLIFLFVFIAARNVENLLFLIVVFVLLYHITTTAGIPILELITAPTAVALRGSAWMRA